MLTARNMDTVGFNLLRDAITAQAVNDYIGVVYCGKKITENEDADERYDDGSPGHVPCKRQKPVTKYSLEKFFKSDYGEMITGIRGDIVIKRLHNKKLTRVEDKDEFQNLLSFYVYGTRTNKTHLARLLHVGYEKMNDIIARKVPLTDEQYETLKKYFITKIGA